MSWVRFFRVIKVDRPIKEQRCFHTLLMTAAGHRLVVVYFAATAENDTDGPVAVREPLPLCRRLLSKRHNNVIVSTKML